MDDDRPLLTIGEVARRAGVATSAVRYYERRGLLAADERHSGQRRYRPETLRRLVFIGMLQDAGLSLDDIDGVLDAATRRRSGRRSPGSRLAVLDDEIARLQHARDLPRRARCSAGSTTRPPTARSWASRSTAASTPGRDRRSGERQLFHTAARFGTAVIWVGDPSGSVWSTSPWVLFE